jgi:hypothetical protein
MKRSANLEIEKVATTPTTPGPQGQEILKTILIKRDRFWQQSTCVMRITSMAETR